MSLMASEGPGKEPSAPATVSASVRDFLRPQSPSAASNPDKNRTVDRLLGPRRHRLPQLGPLVQQEFSCCILLHHHTPLPEVTLVYHDDDAK